MKLKRSFRGLIEAGISGLNSRAGRAIVLYALAFGFAGLTPFVLLPVLTHKLSPAEFGQATSWIILCGLIANICGISAHGLISVRFFKVDREALRRLMPTALGIIVLIHAALVLYLLVGPDFLGRFTHLSVRYSIGAAIVATLISFNLVGLALMQVSNRPGVYLALRILQSAIEIGGCFLLLRVLPATPDVRILSYGGAVAASAVSGLAFIAMKGLLARPPQVAAAYDIVRFGAPMVPHVIAGQLLGNLDRLMVAYVLGADQLGLFMVASQLGMALSLVIEPLNRALAPWLFEHLAKDQAVERAYIVRATYWLFAGLAVISLVAAAGFIALFSSLFSPEYAVARMLVLPVAIGMTFQGMYYGVVNYVFYAEATARLSLTSTVTVSLAAISSYLLVAHMGITGAGLSFMLTNAALFFAVWHLSRKVVPMPWFGTRVS